METNSIPAVPLPPELEALKPLVSLLGPHFSFLIPLMTYMVVIQTIGRLLASKIESGLSSRLAYRVEDAGSYKDERTQRLLNHWAYKNLAFWTNFIFRVNLPDIDSYMKHMKAQRTETTFLTKKDVDDPPAKP